MAEIPLWLLPHTIDKVETYAGTSGQGDVYAPVIENLGPVQLDHTRRLVRDDQGDEVVSETTVRARTLLANRFTPGTRVKLEDRTAIVITRKVWTDAGIGVWQHVEITLT